MARTLPDAMGDSGATRRGGRHARVWAQAKVNLDLRVLGREESGYHQLETVFQRITLGDDVSVEITDGERLLEVSGADTGPVAQNLAWRAAEAYSDAAGWPRGWRISLAKNIPPGGGLGGGSADAGAVLRILNRLNATPLDHTRLLNLAFRLGADVPFLTSELPLALAWGRGERMLALNPLPQRPVVLWMYPFGVSTREAFGWLAAARSRSDGQEQAAALSRSDRQEQAAARSPSDRRPPSGARQFGADFPTSWVALAEGSENHLEAAVFERHPELAAGLAALSTDAGRVLARMTGTGSTLFALPLEIPEGGECWSPPEPPAGTGAPRQVQTSTALRVEEVEIIE